MKSHVIADFIAEFVIDTEEVMKKLGTPSNSELFMDGSSNAQGSGARILLKIQNGDLLEHSLRFSSHALNNEVEYEVLITGLGLAKKFEETIIVVSSDSQLIVNQ